MTTKPFQSPILHGVRSGPRASTPIVFLHSAGLDLTYWDSQFVAFQDRDVVAFDLPGHGASMRPATDITIERMTAEVSESVRALNAGPVHLVGLSVGGVVAQSVSLHAPELVASLTLIDTAARFSPEGQQAMRTRAELVATEGMSPILAGLFSHWFEPNTLASRPDLVDRATKTLMNDDVDVHAALWRMIADFDVLESLGQIDVPTLVLVGEHDSSSPVAASEELVRGISTARMLVIPGAAHLSPLEHPAVLSQHLRNFLLSIEPSIGSSL
jgi:3-oxoadipate enol-lactonase